MLRSRAAVAAAVTATAWVAFLFGVIAGKSGLPVPILPLLILGAAGGNVGLFIGWRAWWANNYGSEHGSRAATIFALVAGFILSLISLIGLVVMLMVMAGIKR